MRDFKNIKFDNNYFVKCNNIIDNDIIDNIS